ncbi:unnamed protein product [Brassica oleracea]
MIGEENLVDQWRLKERGAASSFKRIGRGDQWSGKLSGYAFSPRFSKYQRQRVCTCHNYGLESACNISLWNFIQKN